MVGGDDAGAGGDVLQPPDLHPGDGLQEAFSKDAEESVGAGGTGELRGLCGDTGLPGLRGEFRRLRGVFLQVLRQRARRGVLGELLRSEGDAVVALQSADEGEFCQGVQPQVQLQVFVGLRGSSGDGLQALCQHFVGGGVGGGLLGGLGGLHGLAVELLLDDVPADLPQPGAGEGVVPEDQAAQPLVGGRGQVVGLQDLVRKGLLDVDDAPLLQGLHVGDAHHGQVPVVFGDGPFGEEPLDMFGEALLQFGGVDVFAVAQDDELLLAPGEEEEAILVHVSQVAGVEPAVGGEDLRGLPWAVVVPHHHVVAFDQNLAVLGAHLVAGDGDSGGAGADASRACEGDHGGRLGHAVSLQQLEAQGIEVPDELGGGGRAAAGDVPDGAAEGVLDLLEDLPGERKGVCAAADPEECAGGEAGADLLHDGVAEELQEPGDCDDEGAVVFLEGLQDGGAGHLRGQHGGGADGKGHDQAAHEGVGVVQRKDHHHAVRRNEDLDFVPHGVGVGEEVPEGEHDALGGARGPRGIHQQRQLAVRTLPKGGGGVRMGGIAVLRGALADLRQGVQGHDNRSPSLQQLQRLRELAPRLAVRPDHRGPAVRENEGDLLGCGHEVHGHRHAAEMPYAVEGADPFQAVGAQKHHAVAPGGVRAHDGAGVGDGGGQGAVGEMTVAADEGVLVGKTKPLHGKGKTGGYWKAPRARGTADSSANLQTRK